MCYIQNKQFDWIMIMNLLLPISFVAFEALVTMHLNSMNKEKNYRVQESQSLKKDK